MPPDPNKVKKLQGDIDVLKKICSDFKSKGDSNVCNKDDRKKAASGQHGLKDNVTYGQARKGLEERIEQLKRDLAKEQQKT